MSTTSSKSLLRWLFPDPFVGSSFVFLFVLVVVSTLNWGLAWLGIHLTGYDYAQSSALETDTRQEPGWHHWCGTDLNGRDVLTRVLFGAQISLLVALFGTLTSLAVGVTYGLISGYLGGIYDSILMRILDVLFSLPQLLLAMILISVGEGFLEQGQALGWLGTWFQAIHVSPRVFLLVLFLGLTQWMTMARIVRGQVLVLREQAYVQAAKALGQSHLQILVKHLLPNLSGIILVYLTLTIPSIMVNESFISFLGLGVQAPLASWGTLIADASGVLNPIAVYWWLLLFPAGTMTLTLLALNFIGDYLRDRFDPRFRKD